MNIQYHITNANTARCRDLYECYHCFNYHL